MPNQVQRCSRDKSRKARAILDVYLHPFLVESHKGNMSEECVLQPHRDMYAAFDDRMQYPIFKPSFVIALRKKWIKFW